MFLGYLACQLQGVRPDAGVEIVDNVHKLSGTLFLIAVLLGIFKKRGHYRTGSGDFREYDSAALVFQCGIECLFKQADRGVSQLWCVGCRMFEAAGSLGSVVSILEMESVGAQEDGQRTAFGVHGAEAFCAMRAIDSHAGAEVVEIIDVYWECAGFAD